MIMMILMTIMILMLMMMSWNDDADAVISILSPVVCPVYPRPWVTSWFLAGKVPYSIWNCVNFVSSQILHPPPPISKKDFFTWSWTRHEVIGGGADAGRAPDGVVGGVGGGGGGVGEEGVRAGERVREVWGGRGGRPLKLTYLKVYPH